MFDLALTGLKVTNKNKKIIEAWDEFILTEI